MARSLKVPLMLGWPAKFSREKQNLPFSLMYTIVCFIFLTTAEAGAGQWKSSWTKKSCVKKTICALWVMMLNICRVLEIYARFLSFLTQLLWTMIMTWRHTQIRSLSSPLDAVIEHQKKTLKHMWFSLVLTHKTHLGLFKTKTDDM